MNQDIDCFVKDPRLLIDLVSDVIDRIDCELNNADTREKEAQLRESANAIEKLEKMGVPVPEPLREVCCDLGEDAFYARSCSHTPV